MDSPVSPKDEICFLRVWNHISNAVYLPSALRMDQGSNSGGGKEFFTPIESSDELRGPNSLLLKGYRGSFLEVKGPECDIH